MSAKQEILRLIANLERELHDAAEAGDTLTCDCRHGEIADCNSVLELMESRDRWSVPHA